MNLSTPVIAHWSYTDLSFLSWNKLGLFLGFCLHLNPKQQLQLCNVKLTKVKIRRKLLQQLFRSETCILQRSAGNVLFCFSVLWQFSVQRDSFDVGIVFCKCWLGTTSPAYTRFLKLLFFFVLSSSLACQLSSDWERLVEVFGFTLHLESNNVDLFVLSD